MALDRFITEKVAVAAQILVFSYVAISGRDFFKNKLKCKSKAFVNAAMSGLIASSACSKRAILNNNMIMTLSLPWSFTEDG